MNWIKVAVIDNLSRVERPDVIEGWPVHRIALPGAARHGPTSFSEPFIASRPSRFFTLESRNRTASEVLPAEGDADQIEDFHCVAHCYGAMKQNI